MSTLARAYGIALQGLHGTPVEVQTHIGPGIVGTTLVGLPDASLREAKERVRAALFSCGVSTLNKRVTVNLSPADLPKGGSGFDAAIAVSMLVARKLLPKAVAASCAYYAELGLDGSFQPVPGVLPAALAAAEGGFARLVVPPSSAREANLVDGVEVVPVAHLSDLLTTFSDEVEPEASWAALEKKGDLALTVHRMVREPTVRDQFGELSDVRGQESSVEALGVAAVGAHHVLMTGNPGVGKTMLAARLPAVLPDLESSDALAVTALHALSRPAGEPTGLAVRPPLQAPHHSATLVSLVGGGTPVRPGAVSLAHGGVLLLDEAPEFEPRTLDALRQPLEKGEITVHRAKCQTTFPARFQMVMTANPCPCGGDQTLDASTNSRGCRCSWAKKRNYWSRLSGPLLDRVDVNIPVRRPHRLQLAAPPKYTTESVKQRVLEARERSKHRWRGTPWHLNSQVPGRHMRQAGTIPDHYLQTLDRSVDEGLVSLRGADRILRLAWSVADFRAHDKPDAADFAFALDLRGEQAHAHN